MKNLNIHSKHHLTSHFCLKKRNAFISEGTLFDYGISTLAIVMALELPLFIG